jgi:hypothetical protein
MRREEGQSNTTLVLGSIVALIVVVGLLVGAFMGIKAMGRYQKRQDAMNRVKVSEIEIRNQEQRVKIAQQEAEIRHEQSKGVRTAQDEIAKTLTPLYVQFEMVEALKEIARSGSNSSVIFIPAGEAGIPVITEALRQANPAPKAEE